MSFNLVKWYRERQRCQRALVEGVSKYLEEEKARKLFVSEAVRTVLSTVQRLEVSMSALTDAVTALTAAKADEGSELRLVLDAVAGFPAKITTAVNDAIAAGADPATLAAIKTATDELVAEHQAMVDALNATPPAPTALPAVTEG